MTYVFYFDESLPEEAAARSEYESILTELVSAVDNVLAEDYKYQVHGKAEDPKAMTRLRFARQKLQNFTNGKK